MFRTILSIAFFSWTISQGQSQSSMRVVITTLPSKVENSPPVASSINWEAPTARTPYYCVGSVGLNAMRFSCPACNSTSIDSEIAAATTNLFTSLGHPVIMISGLQVGPEFNGKALQCDGDDGTSGSYGPSTQAVFNIRYLEKPTIVNKDGEGPAKQSDGTNRFYLATGGVNSLPLRCNASGNPTPSSFIWKMDGKTIGTSVSYTATQKDLEQSIICAVNNGQSNYVDSDGVKISPWEIPAIFGNNFRSLESSQSQAFVNGKAKVDATLNLICQVTGNPQPFVIWRIQDSINTVYNLSCEAERNEVIKYPGRPYNPPGQATLPPNSAVGINTYLVQSTCQLLVRNYSFAGKVWCSACNSVSATSNHCDPALESPPSNAVTLEVTGKPLMANDFPTAEMLSSSQAKISVYYCASPAPPLPRGVYWQIDGQNVQIGSGGKFQPQQPKTNGTYCFTEELIISPFTAEDETKQYVLMLSNDLGQSQIPVNVRALINGGTEPVNSSYNVGLAVGLALGFFVLFVIIVVAVLWWRSLACFAGKKTPEKYQQSNVAPEHVRSEPVQQYSAPPYNGYNAPPSEKNDGFYGSIRPGDREGMGFAEMDLTPNTRPDYPQYPLKSATNSVV